ncbi:MAG: ribose-phosphate pyrophosphokinase [Nitrospirae bacterium]|nr:ribose-phosphate pyrophosphokinase [Nitrospirota bacterium]
MEKLVLFAGNSCRALAERIARYLSVPLGDSEVTRFPDGEVQAEIRESVRGADVYIIQSTSTPVNENLMELMVMADALKRASAGRITAVLPYFGYARQDRIVAPRAPISARLVANLMTASGIDHVLALDLHSGQIQGFFDIPCDNLFATPVLLDYIRRSFETRDLVIVSPDAGGAQRARVYAKHLQVPLAIVDKRRERPGEAQVMHVIGDVAERTAIMLDDMVDTAGTLAQGAEAMMTNGAKAVYACATHPVLSYPAVDRIEKSPLKELIVTDSVPLRESGAVSKKIKVLSVAPLLGAAIKRIHLNESLSDLYN